MSGSTEPAYELPAADQASGATLDPAVRPEIERPVLEIRGLSLWYGAAQAL